MSVQQSYLPSLTGLRFYAALLVVLYHLTRNAGEVPLVSELVRFGRTGVTFFFVLSGFVLTWSYWGRRTSVKVFFWRRFARIWPLHVMATFITGWTWIHIEHRYGGSVTWDNLWPSLLLIHTWFPEWTINWGWSGASWSLGDEAFFYAVFPIIVTLLATFKRPQLLAIPILMMSISLLLWLTIPLEGIGPYLRTLLLDYFPLSRVVQFICGVSIACLMRKGWTCPISVPGAFALVIAWHIVLYIWSEIVEKGSAWYPYSASQLFAALPFAILIAAVATEDLANRPSHLAHPVFVLLGQASFAWYLLHGPVILLLVHALGGGPFSRMETLLIWGVVLIVSQAIAILAYKYFEHPVEQRLRSWVNSSGGLTFGPGATRSTVPSER